MRKGRDCVPKDRPREQREPILHIRTGRIEHRQQHEEDAKPLHQAEYLNHVVVAEAAHDECDRRGEREQHIAPAEHVDDPGEYGGVEHLHEQIERFVRAEIRSKDRHDQSQDRVEDRTIFLRDGGSERMRKIERELAV